MGEFSDPKDKTEAWEVSRERGAGSRRGRESKRAHIQREKREIEEDQNVWII